MGITAAAQSAVQRRKVANRGHHFLSNSILAGVLLALLIGVALFAVAAFTS
jgi:hypothetical protein